MAPRSNNERHRTENTTAYRLVQQHTGSFIAQSEASTSRSLPQAGLASRSRTPWQPHYCTIHAYDVRMTLTVRTEQLQQMADAEPGKVMVQPCASTAHWIEFRLVDESGRPVPYEPYDVRLPDQSRHRGELDHEGKVRFEGILPGQASISFPGIDEKEWWPLGASPLPAGP
jgi:hypothetical protein